MTSPDSKKSKNDQLSEFKKLLKSKITNSDQFQRLLELYDQLSDQRAIFTDHLKEISQDHDRINKILLKQAYNGRELLKNLIHRIDTRPIKRSTEGTYSKGAEDIGGYYIPGTKTLEDHDNKPMLTPQVI